jgi:deoxyribose-phosphate aldolase
MMVLKNLEEFTLRLDPRDFAQYLDNTLLNFDVAISTVLSYIKDTEVYGFKCLVLSPYHANYVLSNKLAENINICSVVGFPMGFTLTKVKVFEAEELLTKGVKEVDIVMNIQSFKNGRYDEVLEDIKSVVDIVKAYGAIAKVIIESPLLTYEEKVKAVEIVVKSGAHYVKTSTGILSKTNLKDVYDLVKISSGRVKVKAAGGFRHAIEVLLAIAIGVNRIGTSTAVQIFREYLKLREEVAEKN